MATYKLPNDKYYEDKPYNDQFVKVMEGNGGSGDIHWIEGTGDGAIITKSNADTEGRAEGNCSISFGFNTSALGDQSTAEGHKTVAYGMYSHTEGFGTMTVIDSADRSGLRQGDGAHAEGVATTACGNYSHVEGSDTVANNPTEHAEGRFNVSNFANNTYGDEGNTQHSIGIGSSKDNRKNAIEVMQNGDVYIFGIGGYDGTNYADAKTLQQIIEELAPRP